MSMFTEGLDHEQRAAMIQMANHDPNISVKIPCYGPSNVHSGYGNHFVQTVLGLLRLGADVNVWPYEIRPPLPAEFLACMLEPWNTKAPVGVCMANPLSLTRIAEYTIGITVWETTNIPPEDCRGSLAQVDELIVPCQDNIALMNKLAPGKPCMYVPEGVDTDFFVPQERDWASTPLKLGMLGDLNKRKGLDLAVECFLELYEDDPSVELYLATSNKGWEFQHLGHWSNIHPIPMGDWTQEQVREFYHSVHALFHPYRAEGWWMPGAEMMATGGIIIAPNLLGAAAYHSSATGWVIPAHMGPVTHWGPHYAGTQAAEAYGEWVDYDREDIKATLVDFVESSPEEKRRRAERAAGQIGFVASWDYHAQKVFERVVNAYTSID